MEKRKMTIHRALSELKIIDSRIEKTITQLKPIGIMQYGKLVNNMFNEEEFKKDAEKKHQSILDLIQNKVLIKSAITKKNSETIIDVAGVKMSISDAINFKNSIEIKRNYIKQLEHVNRQTLKSLEQNNMQVDANALKLAEAALQKDNVKINDGDALAITEPYLKANRFELVDPISLTKEIEKLTEEIDNFEGEVDAVLSEINAVTIIEI